MPVLWRKGMRELWRMRGQALAIVLLVGAGIASLIASFATYQSLRDSRSSFYSQERFGDVFVELERAPQRVGEHIAEIPGVSGIQTRVRWNAQLTVQGFTDPINAALLSLPERGESSMNQVRLLHGRWPDSTRDGEVVVTQQFADAHSLDPGANLRATINGRRRTLQVVGIGLSPEFIYVLKPGSLIPDNKRYGVLWLPRDELAAATDMESAFNSVVLTLGRGAEEERVIQALDDLLERYGSGGAYGRGLQQSSQFLESEFEQLRSSGTVVPMIFLAVAVFLLNIVIGRVVKSQREAIGTLRAFGYSRTSVGLHYLMVSTSIVVLGCVVGLLAGTWLGQQLMSLYDNYYYLPDMRLQVHPSLVATSTCVTLAGATLGTLRSALRAAQLPPAEAMRPEPPPAYRRTLLDGSFAQRLLPQAWRMILRRLQREPVKALLSIVGIAFAAALMVAGNFWHDAAEQWLNATFDLSSREDAVVSFNNTADARVVYDLWQLDGVQAVEGFRAVSVKFRHSHFSRYGSVVGVDAQSELHRLVQRDLSPVHVPTSGIVMTDILAERLGLRPGDTFDFKVMEGRRETFELTLMGVIDDLAGLNAYMDRDALHTLLKEEPVLSGAYIGIEDGKARQVNRKLQDAPAVAAVTLTQVARDKARQMMDQQVLVMSLFQAVLASIIAFGVVYNVGRIALAERARELASMRVLGFTRGEVSKILLGEMALLTVSALPLGCGLGYLMAAGSVKMIDPELFRMPMVILPRTYALACVVVLASAALTGLIVRKRIDDLDMVEALKVKE